MSELDTTNTKSINYTEFLVATIDVKKYLTEEKLDALFSSFDPDEDGKITKEDIVKSFSKFGKDVKE